MDDERKKILKMIEDGVISSEEAAELLDSIDRAEKAKQNQQLSKQVDWEKGNEYQSQNRNYDSTKKSSLFSLLEQAVTKIKNVDLDFNFGAYEKVSHIYHSQAEEFSKIDVDISNGSVTLMSWEEEDTRVECEARVYQEETKDKARQRFLDEVEYEIEDEVMRLLIPSKQMKVDVTIKVPSRLYKKISLRLFNGPITAEQIQVGMLRVKTTNGAVNLKHITAVEVDSEASNGPIKINSSAIDDLEAETINGSIRIDGDFEKIDSQTVNGSIHCGWDGTRGQVGYFKTTTGSVRLSVSQARHIDGQLVTNIGAIHCDLPDYKIYDEKKEMIKRSLHFSTNDHLQSLLHIEAETKTGSVWVLPID